MVAPAEVVAVEDLVDSTSYQRVNNKTRRVLMRRGLTTEDEKRAVVPCTALIWEGVLGEGE